MSVKHLTERTIYVAQCPTCEHRSVVAEHPPREHQCPTCHTWTRYIEESYVGPDKFGGSR